MDGITFVVLAALKIMVNRFNSNLSFTLDNLQSAQSTGLLMLFLSLNLMEPGDSAQPEGQDIVFRTKSH